jgi:thiamine-monophosphate kinase
MASERERVALLRALLEGGVASGEGATDARASARGVLLGIGDDAAVLTASSGPLVVSVDAMVEGVHFKRGWLTHRELGYKATMAAASDLAAMGARPRAVLAALTLTEDVDDEELAELARGQAEACRALGTLLVGGNLSRGRELCVATTVVGEAAQPLRRSGAHPGDLLLLSGSVGLAGAGLDLVSRGRARASVPPEAHLSELGSEVVAASRAKALAVAAWLRPRARVAEGLAAAAAGATAAIDVSDGLALDAAQLAEASGVRAVLEAEPLVEPALAAMAARLGAAALELALHRGEDYALLVAAPPGTRIEGFRPIGRCEPLPAGEPSLLLREAGVLRPIEARGFDHFASS